MRDFLQALEDRHLDIGTGHHRKHGGSRHAHHMGDDDQDQRQHRQERIVEAVDETRVRRHVGERGKPAKIDRDIFDEKIGEEIFRHRDRHQGEEVDQPVEDAALPDRRQEPEADRQRHRDHRRIGGEKHRIGEARRDFRQHVAAIGERMAEIAAQRPEQPVEESQDAGRSRPRSRRSLARLSGVAEFCRIAEARSPGKISVPMKMRTDAANRVEDAEAEPLEHEIQHNAGSLALS